MIMIGDMNIDISDTNSVAFNDPVNRLETYEINSLVSLSTQVVRGGSLFLLVMCL